MKKLICLAVSLCALSAPFAARASATLHLVSTVPLPEIKGGDFDHFAVDIPHSRLYVSAEVNGSIEVFHLPDGRHIASIKSVSVSPHKIALANNGRDLIIADAGSAEVVVADTHTFKIKARIPMQPQPDSGTVDPRDGVFYIGNGGIKGGKDYAYISRLATQNDALLSRVRVPSGEVKGMEIDPRSNRLFVNFRDRNEIGVIDIASDKLVTTFHVPGPSRNSAMALDTTLRRLYIGSRNPGKLFVMDLDSGVVLQTLDITNIADEIAVDSKRSSVYVAGEGGLDVIQYDPHGTYSKTQHIDTLGGKTFAFVPEYDRLYVVHTKGPLAAEAGLQIFSLQTR
jgi:DNA-binding beta-propeller fold protein YncE